MTTNFPNGITVMGVPYPQADSGGSGSNDSLRTGKVLFVGPSGSDSNSGVDKDNALATIDYAIGLCTASQDDTIYVLPGYTQTITAAAGIDIDVEGVSIIGLGSGTSRPTITFGTATTADIDFDADSVSIENFIFVCNIDSLAAALDINDTDVTIKNCEFRDTNSGKQTLAWIVTDANASRLTVEGCKFDQQAAGAACAIRIIGGSNSVIRGCNTYGDYSVADISNITTLHTNLTIEGCQLNNLNAVDVNIDLHADTTGFVRYNQCRVATDAELTWIDVAKQAMYENYGVNNNGETGKLIGTASA